MTPAGRRRRNGNEWRPANVGLDRYGYYYKNNSTKDYARLRRADGSIITSDASKSEVWAAYDALTKVSAYTFNSVIDKYFLSPQFIARKPQTQRDYQQYAGKIRAVFGDMHTDTLSTAHVRLFMDKRGLKHPTAANHEKSFLSVVVNWARERGYMTIANPCTGVKNYQSASPGKSVEDVDYYGFYNLLISDGYVMHAAAMEIAYLCGSRQQDVLRVYDTRPIRPKETDCYVDKTGIRIWQAKTGKVQLKRWTPRLQAATELARKHKSESKKRQASPWLICTKSGTKFTRTGFNSTWMREQRKAESLGFERFRFHDTKHKAISDFEGDKQEFSGHATRSMVNRYDHSVTEVDTVNKPMQVDKHTGRTR